MISIAAAIIFSFCVWNEAQAMQTTEKPDDNFEIHKTEDCFARMPEENKLLMMLNKQGLHLVLKTNFVKNVAEKTMSITDLMNHVLETINELDIVLRSLCFKPTQKASQTVADNPELQETLENDPSHVALATMLTLLLEGISKKTLANQLDAQKAFNRLANEFLGIEFLK